MPLDYYALTTVARREIDDLREPTPMTWVGVDRIAGTTRRRQSFETGRA